ncbi:MAG: phosphatidylglycerophosphatase A [Bacteroidota bacterium]|nr:phosphatidylglycerophosphatase A [Bacteroidota bacterium]MDP4230011.1 phosphatidylglycerophosphatase A [Bacteroidota bacterium]MDP4234820.1 phosphatidylglycerophosphatase A [Bacteroidota bacterium]
MSFDPIAKARSRLWAIPTVTFKHVPTWAIAIGTFGFIGLSPVASGTVGSAAGALLYYYLPFLQNNWILLASSLLIFIAGTVATDVIELKMGEHDPGIVVIDEVLGQWVALFSVWYIGDPLFVVVAFLFFRFFDIIKLYPASVFESRFGGTSVMLDDVVAGVYANICAHLATWIIKSFFGT